MFVQAPGELEGKQKEDRTSTVQPAEQLTEQEHVLLSAIKTINYYLGQIYESGEL